MTTTPSTNRRPRLSTRTLSVRMIAASLAAAGAIFGGLAVQMANGHDPALGAGTSSAQTGSSGGQSGSSSGQSSQSDGSSGDPFVQDQSSQQDQSGGSPSGVVTRAS
jgi:hypothetical protein